MKFLVSTIAASVLFVGGSVVEAGTITTSRLDNDETDVVNTGGTLVSAATFGAPSAAILDINGIGHVTGSVNDAGLTTNFFNEGDFRGAQAATAGYTDDMLTLMTGIGIMNPPTDALELDISGLSVGKKYLFQTYWEANNFGQTASITFEGVDTLGGITGFGVSPTPPETGTGVLISYEFTAGDTELNVDFLQTAGTNNTWLQGYSLQVVPAPEPSTFVLTALAIASMGIVHRRRRR